MLAGLTLDLACLAVALGNRGCEVTGAWQHHDEGHVCLGRSGDDVLDEVAVTWGINDGVMPFVSEEHFGGAGDGHAALALLLLPIHVKGSPAPRADGASRQ